MAIALAFVSGWCGKLNENAKKRKLTQINRFIKH